MEKSTQRVQLHVSMFDSHGHLIFLSVDLFLLRTLDILLASSASPRGESPALHPSSQVYFLTLETGPGPAVHADCRDQTLASSEAEQTSWGGGMNPDVGTCER